VLTQSEEGRALRRLVFRGSALRTTTGRLISERWKRALPSGRLSSDGYNHGLTKILVSCLRDALNNMEDQFMHAHEENQRIDQASQEPSAITLLSAATDLYPISVHP
jgi:hypothetical protein